jgi:hypothetical protein
MSDKVESIYDERRSHCILVWVRSQRLFILIRTFEGYLHLQSALLRDPLTSVNYIQ